MVTIAAIVVNARMVEAKTLIGIAVGQRDGARVRNHTAPIIIPPLTTFIVWRSRITLCYRSFRTRSEDYAPDTQRKDRDQRAQETDRIGSVDKS